MGKVQDVIKHTKMKMEMANEMFVAKKEVERTSKS